MKQHPPGPSRASFYQLLNCSSCFCHFLHLPSSCLPYVLLLSFPLSLSFLTPVLQLFFSFSSPFHLPVAYLSCSSRLYHFLHLFLSCLQPVFLQSFLSTTCHPAVLHQSLSFPTPFFQLSFTRLFMCPSAVLHCSLTCPSPLSAVLVLYATSVACPSLVLYLSITFPSSIPHLSFDCSSIQFSLPFFILGQGSAGVSSSAVSVQEMGEHPGPIIRPLQYFTTVLYYSTLPVLH